MYEVIRFFTDLQDSNHPYNVGDTYPREGVTVKPERIAELAGASNRQFTPLIREVAAAVKDDKKSEGHTRSEIALMRKADLVKLAEENGIDGADGMSGNALKGALIEKLGL